MWVIKLARAILLAVIDEHAANIRFTEQHPTGGPDVR